jgi:hypothetical protein
MNTYDLTLKLIKCSKDKCKKEHEKASTDENLKKDRMKLIQSNNLKEINELIKKIYSNKLQNNIDICAYKKCKVHKQLYELRIKSLKDKIKVYNIKLTTDLKNKFDELIKLNAKPSFTDEELLKSIIIIQTLQRFINDKIKTINEPFIKLLGDYISCGKKNCNVLFEEVKNDKILTDKKMKVSSIKDDEKRNKIIKEIYSNEKQIKLDKCITKKCNKLSLKLIQDMTKIFNNKIKVFNLKPPEHIKIPDIKKISEDDIPEIIIKLNQLSKYIDKYVGNI